MVWDCWGWPRLNECNGACSSMPTASENLCMKRLVALYLLGIALPMLTWQASAAAMEETPSPGREEETTAEGMERRDETMAAQMEYMEAFRRVTRAARQQGEDAPLLHARGEFLLEKAAALSESTGNTEDLLELLKAYGKEEAARSTPGAALLLARSRWLRARLLLKLARPEEATAAAQPLELLQEWLLAGPFDNERGRSFATAFGPERPDLDLNATYPGKKRPVRWRHHRTRDPLGIVNLDALFRPNTECLAYALCLIESPRNMEAALRFGSDDGIVVWVNRRQVFRNPFERRLDFDQSATGIKLQKGWNSILVKVAQSRDQWGFCMRITGPAGAPIKGLRIQSRAERIGALLASVAADTSTAPLPGIDRGAVSLLAERVQNNETRDAHHAYYLAYLLMQRSHLGRNERYDEQLLKMATAEEEKSIYLLALAAAARDDNRTAPDREENERRRALLRARDLGEEEVAATVELARYYFEAMVNLDRADALVSKALKINPLSQGAQLLRYEIYRRRGWQAQAARLIDTFIRRSPASFHAHMLQGQHRLQLASPATALASYNAARRLDALDERALQAQHECLLQQGDRKRALANLRRYLKLKPYNRWASLQIARTLRNTDRAEEALPVIRRALADCPGDHELVAEEGFCLYALGQQQAAFASWQRARELEPAYLPLKRYLRFLGSPLVKDHAQTTDLAALAEKATADDVPPGQSRVYLRHEQIDRVNADGTRQRMRHKIVHVLDQEGSADLRRTRIYYNPEIEAVTVQTARVRHADGRTGEAQPRTIHQSRYSLHVLDFPALTNGDLIEVRYSVDRFAQDFFGDYFGQIYRFRRTAPVRLARYVLVTPAKRRFYFHRTGGAPEPAVRQDPGAATTTRIWEMKDLAAIAEEPHMPPDADLSPSVQVSTFSDWDALAKWYWHLVKKQNIPTTRITDKVGELTAHMTDEEDKIRSIFAWVSREIRNVAWSFGVHGYKPYSAKTIFSRRFGDCKDKSTLINVMAGEAGIAGWPVLVRAIDPQEKVSGRGNEDLTLPILNHFNHCISQVHMEKRSLFLDGTISYRTPEGIHYTIAGAKAVVVGPDGAERVTLPSHTAESNLWSDRTRITIEENGGASLSQKLEARGNVALYMRAYFSNPSACNMVMGRIAQRSFGPIRNAEASFEDKGVGPDAVRLTSQVRIRKYAQPDGNRLRVSLPKVWLRGKLGKGGAIPGELVDFTRYSTRLHDLVLPMVFCIKREITLAWPQEWRLATALNPVDLDTPFGTLKVSYKRVGTTLTITHLLQVKEARIRAEDYPAFRRFCILADRFDKNQLILEKP